MSELAKKKCKPCEGGVKPYSATEAKELLKDLKGWKIENNRLTKTYAFENYYQTMAFVNALAWVSHREDHHPDLGVALQQVQGRVLDARDRRAVGERLHLRRQVRRAVPNLKRVFSSFNQTAVHHAQNLLQAAGHPRRW